jgi:hypothetical protein
MGGPSHGLSTVPAWESICREAGVDESEMRREEHVIQIMIIVVHLRRSKLAFIDDVFARERADVKPFR